MSDPPKVVIKSKVTIPSDDDEPRSSGRESANGNFPRRSVRRKSSRKSDLSVESITLQETAPKSQPVTLKASFLRRKIKEYEGKKALDKSSSIIGKNVCVVISKVDWLFATLSIRYCRKVSLHNRSFECGNCATIASHLTVERISVCSLIRVATHWESSLLSRNTRKVIHYIHNHSRLISPDFFFRILRLFFKSNLLKFLMFFLFVLQRDTVGLVSRDSQHTLFAARLICLIVFLTVYGISLKIDCLVVSVVGWAVRPTL